MTLNSAPPMVTVPTRRTTQARPGRCATRRRMLWIKGPYGRRPFARTLTRLQRLCADSVTCRVARPGGPYGRPMIALLAASLTLVAPVPGPVARSFAYGADPFRA